MKESLTFKLLKTLNRKISNEGEVNNVISFLFRFLCPFRHYAYRNKDLRYDFQTRTYWLNGIEVSENFIKALTEECKKEIWYRFYVEKGVVRIESKYKEDV